MDIEKINEKMKVLDNAQKELKNYFVGLDNIIDKIIENIRTWYLMPELIGRPTIVCLWGTTGVGKTDLVRKLVKLIGFQDKFFETLLGCNDNYIKSVSGLLRNSNVMEKEPSIVLFDEMQNFRTKDEEGREVEAKRFNDVWTLLSDGKLPYSVEVETLTRMLWDLNKEEQNKSKVKEKGEEKTEYMTSSLDDIPSLDEPDIDESYYGLNHFKSLLKLDESIDEISTWDNDKKRNIIIDRLTTKKVFEEEDYTKCLIFISGNLDEAYECANEVDEVDLNADIIHEESKKISILNIKKSLYERFKPEQISRFGNNHIIYRTFNEKTFRKLIDKKIDYIIDDVKKKADIDLTIDNSIKDLVYKNGVYPTQGARPLFSTISDIVENSLPNVLFECLMNNQKNVYLYYENKKIIGTSINIKIEREYEGSIDCLKRKNSKNIDRKTLVSVHESAHAMVSSLLFKRCPKQVTSNLANDKSYGFHIGNENFHSKKTMLERVMVGLAGTVAEEIVFGKNNVCSGCSSDIDNVTCIVTSMIRKLGMYQFTTTFGCEKRDWLNTDLQSTNKVVEDVVKGCRNNCKILIEENIKLLLDLSDFLINNGFIKDKDYIEIFKKHGKEIMLPKEDDLICYQYSEVYQSFKKRKEEQ